MRSSSRHVLSLLVICASAAWCLSLELQEVGASQEECSSTGVCETIPIPARAESLLQVSHLRGVTMDSVDHGTAQALTVYDDAVDTSCEVGKHCAMGMPEPRGACVHPHLGQPWNECWDICNDRHLPEEYVTGDPVFDEQFADAVRHVRSGQYMHMSCSSLLDSKAKFDVSGTMQEVKKALEAAEEARLVTRAAAIEAKDLVNASQEKRNEAAEVMQEAATAEANALSEARKAMQAIERLAAQKEEKEAEDLEEKRDKAEAKAEEAAAKLERQRELDVAAKEAEEAAINATLKVNETGTDEGEHGNETGAEEAAHDLLPDSGKKGSAIAELKAKLKRQEAEAIKAMHQEEEKAAAAAAAWNAFSEVREAAKINGTDNATMKEVKEKRSEARKTNVEAKVASHEAKKAIVAAKKTLAELEKAKLQGKVAEHEAVIGRLTKLEADLKHAKSVAVRLRAELEAEKEVERQLAEVLKEAEAAARLAEMQVAEAEVDEIAAEAAVEEAESGIDEAELNSTLVNQTVVVVNETGATAPLNETGIQAVADLHSLAEMEVFIVRVVTSLKLKIINATGLLMESVKLMSAADSTRKQNRSFTVLEEDINHTLFWGPRPDAWVGAPILVDHPHGPDLKKWGRRATKTVKKSSKGDMTESTCYWKAVPPCVQEFMYAGASHEGCTTEDATDGAWCSFDALYVGRWAHCTYICEEGFLNDTEGY